MSEEIIIETRGHVRLIRPMRGPGGVSPSMP
jgi:hypothetical protein